LRQSDLAVARGATASADIVVRPRDTVNVTARKGNLTVSMQGGVALEKGGVGDTIRVRNPTSTRTITARIVAPGKVEVSL
jgi:flagella basal body P-ring formation protein FlgA